nr:MAG TPA_asm: hypothetical protein [Caudoviricetes sp.]
MPRLPRFLLLPSPPPVDCAAVEDVTAGFLSHSEPRNPSAAEQTRMCS